MTKNILTIAFMALTLGSINNIANAAPSVEVIDIQQQQIQISVNGNNLHVVGASGKLIRIYNVAGVQVKTIKCDSSDRSFELNLPKGCYIVQIDKTARKITIQ